MGDSVGLGWVPAAVVLLVAVGTAVVVVYEFAVQLRD
jgi:hypothetical protein